MVGDQHNADCMNYNVPHPIDCLVQHTSINRVRTELVIYL